jgi:hypothetical protein
MFKTFTSKSFAQQCLLLTSLMTGCAGLSNGTHIQPVSRIQPVAENLGQPMIEYGRENVVVDSIGWVVGIPAKITLWNRRASNHQVSEETVAKIEEHLNVYGLHDTKVRINQYDPMGEWQRLRENKHMHPGWKYSFGTLQTLGYTILPGRILGGDGYNPYTNTVNVYSDIPSIGMTETAYAYDISQRQHPGLYTTTQSIPLVNMYHKTLATDRTVNYLAEHGTPEELKEAYNVLYPRYGQAMGSSVGSYVEVASPIGFLDVTGLIAGHAYGRYQSAQVDKYQAQVKAEQELANPLSPESQLGPVNEDKISFVSHTEEVPPADIRGQSPSVYVPLEDTKKLFK